MPLCIHASFYTLYPQLTLADEQCEVTRNGLESKEPVYLVQIYCQVGHDTVIGLLKKLFRCLSCFPHMRQNSELLQKSSSKSHRALDLSTVKA